MDARRIPIGSATHGRKEAEAVRRVVASGRLAGGPEVAAFERELAEVVGTDDAVAVSSGTAALELALRALGVGRGDEVVTTPFSFFATAAAILHTGATPVFADIDPVSCNVTPESVAAAIGRRTAAIMPVHLYGRPCDMTGIGALARRHGLAIVEDACQAIGARHAGRPAGSFGLGCFSFYGSKNISAGEGGAVALSDPALATRLRDLRNHGSAVQYRHTMVAWNQRMTDLQAAILRVQLGRLGEITRKRRRLARRYDRELADTGLGLPPANDDVTESCYHLYTVQVPSRRARLQEHLERAGVEARVYYPRPMYRQPAWPGPAMRLPNAERASRRVLSLPLHPGLSEGDVAYVAEAVRAFARR